MSAGTIRLVQLQRGGERRVARVDEPRLQLLSGVDCVYSLARSAAVTGVSLSELIDEHATGVTVAYAPIYEGQSEWRLLTPADHPFEPARCLVSGTGLTHLGSATNRNTMHEVNDTELTDSMKMFRWGVDGGRPAPGQVGIPPEWFYKGDGSILRAHGEPLMIPPYGEDGGEEAEVAGIYLIGSDGEPMRIGMCLGNEFSDHRFEKKNYLNLASSKIRTCSIGPELVIDPDFDSVAGAVTVERARAPLWTKSISTGEAEMCHSLQNVEHHHFKFGTHRRPGDVHVHYFGACSLSFGDGIQLQEHDVMEVAFEGFGRPLRNPLLVDKAPNSLVTVRSLA